MRTNIALATAAVLLVASTAFGQAPTTVQLPTFRIFSVQTTVSVPDSGGASLGGISRAYDSSRSRGLGPSPLLGSRGLATGRSAGGMSVHATIHDLPAMDEALLAEAAAKRSLPLELGTTAKIAAISESVGRPQPVVVPSTLSSVPRGSAPLSVAAIREQNAQAALAHSADMAATFAKAEQAERDSKPVVARIYYEMVTRGNSDQWKQLAQARLEYLSGKSKQVAGR